MTIEEILHSAYNRGFRKTILERVTKDYSKEELKYKYEKAYFQTLQELMEKGILEKKNWESAMIRSTTYNFEEETLVIEFNNEAEYSYSGVTQKEYQDFVAAESKGKHFIANFRNKKEYLKRDESQKN